MNATLKRLVLAMAFALPIGALVLPPAPAQAQASSTGMEQPTGKTSKATKKKGAKKTKARAKSTTTG